MNDQDLDRTYTALCQAMSAVGQDKATLFLAMLCLSLVSHNPDAAQVLVLLEQAKARCLDSPPAAAS